MIKKPVVFENETSNPEKEDIKNNFSSDLALLNGIIAPGPRTQAEQRQDNRNMARILKRILLRRHQKDTANG